VAGATDLAVESNLFARRWSHLVSLEAIDELREFSNTGQSITIGSALTLSELGRRWSDAPDVFREWLLLFASPLIRNRATLGGNLATASPIGDAAPLLLALDALIHLAGFTGRRTIPLSSFFTAYRKTAMEQGEIITAIEIPKPLPQFVRFYKVAKRKLDDISTVAAAMSLDLDAQSRVRRARFAYGGVAATPIRVADAETAIAGQPWNDAAVERVQAILDRTLQPMSDHRGSKEYRLEVSKSLVEKYQWEYAQ
jgi:xanthine dehydrogenase small subunit